MARAVCEHCKKEYLIEDDAPVGKREGRIQFATERKWAAHARIGYFAALLAISFNITVNGRKSKKSSSLNCSLKRVTSAGLVSPQRTTMTAFLCGFSDAICPTKRSSCALC